MTKKKKIIAVIVFMGLFLVIYAAYNPETSVIFPKCPFKMITGLECPSCGSQRALHALLTGDIKRALSYNYFLILSIPYIILVVFTTLSSCNLALRMKKWVLHRHTVNAYFILLIIWWIVRNII